MDVEEESGEEIPLDPSEQQILDTANQWDILLKMFN